MVLSLKTIPGPVPFFYPNFRLGRILFNLTIYHTFNRKEESTMPWVVGIGVGAAYLWFSAKKAR